MAARRCRECGSLGIKVHKWFWYGDFSTNCKCEDCGFLWPEIEDRKPKKEESPKERE